MPSGAYVEAKIFQPPLPVYGFPFAEAARDFSLL